jgi:hypothetical protein
LSFALRVLDRSAEATQNYQLSTNIDKKTAHDLTTPPAIGPNACSQQALYVSLG